MTQHLAIPKLIREYAIIWREIQVIFPLYDLSIILTLSTELAVMKGSKIVAPETAEAILGNLEHQTTTGSNFQCLLRLLW